MVNLYVNLIRKGLRTIEQVPGLWRPEVEQILAEEEQLSKIGADLSEPTVGG